MNFQARKFLGHLKRDRLPKIKKGYRFKPFQRQSRGGVSVIPKRNRILDLWKFKPTWSPGNRDVVYILQILTYES